MSNAKVIANCSSPAASATASPASSSSPWRAASAGFPSPWTTSTGSGRTAACRLEHPEYDLLPSEYFKRQMYGCFWFETDTAKSAIEQLGPDCILYETDFPHPTSMSPGPATSAVSPRKFVAEELGDLPRDVLQRILHDNAAELYHLD